MTLADECMSVSILAGVLGIVSFVAGAKVPDAVFAFALAVPAVAIAVAQAALPARLETA